MDNTNKEWTIKAQEAADMLLREEGRPMPSREVAKRMLDRGFVGSRADDPVFSLATTLEKNVRDGRYNDPPLKFVYQGGKPRYGARLIALTEWGEGSSSRSSIVGTTSPPTSDRRGDSFGPQLAHLEVKIPSELFEKLERARTIGFGLTMDDVTARLLEAGLTAVSDQLRERARRWIEEVRF